MNALSSATMSEFGFCFENVSLHLGRVLAFTEILPQAQGINFKFNQAPAYSARCNCACNGACNAFCNGICKLMIMVMVVYLVI
jgi:hypothetical protein